MTETILTIDDYITASAAQVQPLLREILERFRMAAPGAVEAIRYGMPAFRLANGHPVYFAAWKKHISVHDIPLLSATLELLVVDYRNGKDTLRFELRQAIPFDLIERIVIELASR